jgi:rhodanese-related sulfurtransferase
LEELAAALEAGAPVIDVRNADEYEEVRIPGVRLIPLGELGERIDEVPSGERVYIVCAAGGRSLTAAKALNDAGFDTVSVRGGTNGWAAEGRPVESGDTGA